MRPISSGEALVRRLLDSLKSEWIGALPGGGSAERQRQVQPGQGRLIPPCERVPAGSDKWFVLELLPGGHPRGAEIGLTRIASQPGLDLIEQLRRTSAPSAPPGWPCRPG
jgi:hypothetical protein